MLIILNERNVNEYLDGISMIHYGAYSKHHFTSCFNKEMLSRYYCFLVGSSDVSIVHLDDDGQVDGFVIAGESVGRGVSQFISAHRLYVVSVLLLNPTFLFEKMQSYLVSKFKQSVSGSGISKFRLMSIAVSSDKQSKGVGAEMLDFFESVLKERGVSVYGLSVRKNNDRAMRFYVRNGFAVEKETNDSVYYFKGISG
ncbi:N-acetyltransferase [Pseudomonas sp.]|uniref:GNAT family N-acetyltransferase n=1 Tax=Pseudomonas sp. TaxID=306 RepID=UPI00299D72C7|nr:N-acetyltransferase [Pseudomonas sp.]MDX1367221.1 N-acetyltransferase [Pseudomonas sp.]